MGIQHIGTIQTGQSATKAIKALAMEGLPDEVGDLKGGTTGTKSGVDNAPLAPLLALGFLGCIGVEGFGLGFRPLARQVWSFMCSVCRWL